MIRRKPEREEITGGAMDIKKEAILKAAGDLQRIMTEKNCLCRKMEEVFQTEQ